MMVDAYISPDSLRMSSGFAQSIGVIIKDPLNNINCSV